MSKSYIINVKIKAESAPVAQRAVADLKTIEAQALKSGNATEASTKKIAVGLEALAVKGLQLQSKLLKGEQDAAAKSKETAEKKAKDIGSLEDRYLKADYDRRVAYEQKKAADADKAVAKKDADVAKLLSIEDRYLKAEYDGRVAAEKKKIAEAEKAIAKKEGDAVKLQAIEDRYLKAEYDGRVAAEKKKIAESDRATAKKEADAAKAVARKDADAAKLLAIEDRYLKAEYDGRVAAEKKKAAEAERATAKKDADAAKLLSIEDRYLKAEYDKRVAYEKKKETQAENAVAAAERRATKLYTKEEALARAKTEVVRRQNDKMVESELALMGVTGRRFQNGFEGADKMISSVSRLALSYVSLQAGMDILKGIGDVAREAAESQAKMTSEYIKYRKAQTEGLDMQGKGVTTKNVLESAKFEAETGLTPEQNKAFTEGFMGSGAQYEGKTLSKEHFAEFKTGAAKLAMATGIDKGIMGEFAGTIGGSRNYEKEHGKDAGKFALADLNKGIAILQRGKGDNATLAKNTSALASFMANPDEILGVFNSVDEYATAISVASEFNPAESAVYAKNAAEAIHPKLETASGKPTQAAGLMKKAGVTEQTKFYDAYKKLAPIVLKEAREKGIDVNTLLRNHYGYGKQQATAMGAFIQKGMGDDPSKGLIQDRFEYGAQFGTPKAVEAKIKASETNDQGPVPHAKAEAANRLAERVRGAETAPVETLTKQAEAVMIDKKAETRTWGESAWDKTLGLLQESMLGGHSALEQRKTQEMEAIIQRRAREQGIKLAPKVLGKYGPADADSSASAEGRQEYFLGRQKEFASQGGSMLIDMTKQMVIELKKLNAPAAPQPMPVNFRNAVNIGMLRW